MSVRIVVRRSLLTVSLVLIAAAAFAQAPATETYKPQVGQAGKDVVWVPTADALVEQMMNLAKVTPQDVVMDLGSGDGRTVIAAAKRGAKAIGVEFNPKMVELSRQNAAQAGVGTRATFIEGDLFKADLTQATVITMFLLPDINLKLRPIILGLKPGTRIVSNTFTMGEWEPDDRFRVSNAECTSWCEALFWLVPARVDGSWKTAQGQLTFKQDFQKVTGTLGTAAISDGRLRGDEITFTAGGTKYTGKVNGNTIQGTAASSSGNASFTASKIG